MTNQLQTQMRTGKKTSKSAQVGTDVRVQETYKPKKPVGKMLLFGAMSISAYVFLFANESLVTQTFTLGGVNAVFPVATAFLFSFVHGAFASNLLSVLGLEAKK